VNTWPDAISPIDAPYDYDPNQAIAYADGYNTALRIAMESMIRAKSAARDKANGGES
jgi:hypothetical protein